jgi:hypothetical protein
MASANSNINITDLDFNNIKTNLKQFLQAQNTLKDYNFDGSALSVLLDVLAYNTQYNAYYMNMVANEMFLDSAIMRSSVVSHAKVLDYTPKSAIGPTATVDVVVNQVGTSSLTMPAYTHFLSEAIDGVNYNFVTLNSYTVNTSSNTATFNNVELKQGIPSSVSYTVDLTTNPGAVFEIPETNVDTTTLIVQVQKTSSNNTFQVYNPATDFLTLDSTSQVYFLQESLTGTYQVYFGDGILGNQLSNGNVVTINYVVTQGTAGAGANNFVLMDTIGGHSNTFVYSITQASQGGDKESIDSIKFQAPKSYSAQGRAVTKDDYITIIQQNSLGYSFDAVNVWGGEENNPPVYGQVFVCIKPTGAYTLTDNQKLLIKESIINPVSVMTVTPTIVDPDYTFIKINSNVVYDPKKTALNTTQLQGQIVNVIQNFSNNNLNTFNSTFSGSSLILAISNADPSIKAADYSIQLQKKFYPILSSSNSYTFDFGVPLNKGVLTSGVSTFPALQFRDPSNSANIIDGIYIEENPSETIGVDSIQLTNSGYSYQLPPVVTIMGDGIGATAVSQINASGQITKITITNAGQNYTQAVVVITPAATDGTGTGAAAVAILQGQFGTLRSFYYNSKNVKTIFNPNVGTIDYINGVVKLNSFSPLDVDNPLGQLTVSVNPKSTIISSTFDKIITVDAFDPTAINVNLTVKN